MPTYKLDTNPQIFFDAASALLYVQAENELTLEITLPGSYLTIEIEDIDVNLYERFKYKGWTLVDSGEALMNAFLGPEPTPDLPKGSAPWGSE